MTDNKSSHWKKTSECKCYYDTLFLSHRIDEKVLVVKVVNHSNKGKGFHDTATIEIPYDIFVDMINEIKAK